MANAAAIESLKRKRLIGYLFKDMAVVLTLWICIIVLNFVTCNRIKEVELMSGKILDRVEHKLENQIKETGVHDKIELKSMEEIENAVSAILFYLKNNSEKLDEVIGICKNRKE